MTNPAQIPLPLESDQSESKGPIENKKWIAILQITRLGDLVQTYQVANQLKEENPDIGIMLIARKQFARPLDFLLKNCFDQIIEIDAHQFLPHGNQTDLDSAQVELKDWLNKVNSHYIDLLVNLSFSKSSSYLAGLINARFKMGPQYTGVNDVRVNDPWSRYIYSTVMNGSFNTFNIVDLYKKILGVKRPILSKARTTPKEKTVLIHPFTSHPKKKWKAVKWSEVIYKMMKDNKNLKVLLAGSQGDCEEVDKILSTKILKKYLPRIENLVGQTSIEELYQRLDKVSFFIGHDSMVGHLASLKGIQTLTISLGTVRPEETTPYGNGNYSLAPNTSCFPCMPTDKCDFYQCHADIPYQVVCASIQSLIDKGEIDFEELKNEHSSFLLSSVTLLRTKQTEGSFLKLERLDKDYLSPKEIFKQLYRILWLFFLDESEEDNGIPDISELGLNQLRENIKGVHLLFDLAEFAKTLTDQMLNQIERSVSDMNKIREYSQKLEEIDQMQLVVGQNYPFLAPLIDYFNVAKGSLEGNNLKELAGHSFYLNTQYATLCSVMYELMEKLIEIYLPQISQESKDSQGESPQKP